MTVNPIVWASRFDPTAASIMVRDGGVRRAAMVRATWPVRAAEAADIVASYIEAEVEPGGLRRFLASSSSAGRLIAETDFASTVNAAVRKARGTLTVALLGLFGDGRRTEAPEAVCAHSAAVLLLAAEPELHALGRQWCAGGIRRTRQFLTLGQVGIGAALLSAHLSGPLFPEDCLPHVAGDLLHEVAA